MNKRRLATLRKSSVAILLILAVLAASCGDPDDNDPNASPEPTESDQSEEEEDANTEDDQSEEEAASTEDDATQTTEPSQTYTPVISGEAACEYRQDLFFAEDKVPPDSGAVPLDTPELLEPYLPANVENISAAEVLEALGNQNVVLHQVTDPDVADSLEHALGVVQQLELAAAPVVVHEFAGHWTVAPGSDPEPLESPYDNIDDLNDAWNNLQPLELRDGVPIVFVLDTGHIEGLPGSWPLDSSVDMEIPESQTMRANGHGSFVSSVIRLANPEAMTYSVRITRSKDKNGQSPMKGMNGQSLGVPVEYDELSFLVAVRRSLQFIGGQPIADRSVLNVSGGSYGCGHGLGIHLGIEDELAPLGDYTAIQEATEAGVEVFAAAGNHGHRVCDALFYPAGFNLTHDLVFGVQSTTGGRELSDLSIFSNKRSEYSWAPGDGIIGRVPGNDAEVPFQVWSGTSFATAIASAGATDYSYIDERRFVPENSTFTTEDGFEKRWPRAEQALCPEN